MNSALTAAVFCLTACATLYETCGQESICGCPDGWTVFRGSCYFFSDETNLDWTEATHHCATLGAHLVVIESHAEDMFLKDHSHRLFKNPADRGLPVGFWIGGTDEEIEGVWVWYTDHSEISKNTYVGHYSPGEPDDVANQDCLFLYGGFDFLWASAGCSMKTHFICEKSMNGGSGEIVG